jgi:hypothetical protein
VRGDGRLFDKVRLAPHIALAEGVELTLEWPQSIDRAE